jgi:membrane protease YdiL (CAAX protease family)
MAGKSEEETAGADQGPIGVEVPLRDPAGSSFSLGFVALFYGAMAGVACLLGYIFELNILVWRPGMNPVLCLAIGVAVGAATVLLSLLLERRFYWARSLSEEFRSILGDLTRTEVFVIAVASGFGEEVLFRGFLQQALSDLVFSGNYANVAGVFVGGLVFGLMHIGPSRTFLPWTAMAVIMGWILGGMYLVTGNVIAVIATHFVVNFCNLTRMMGQR